MDSASNVLQKRDVTVFSLCDHETDIQSFD